MRELTRDKQALFRRMASMGDVTQIKLGFVQPIALATHPDHVKLVLVTHQKNFSKGPGLAITKPLLGEGLLTSEGDFHLRQRRLIQPAFHRERIAGYGTIMSSYAEETQRTWTNGSTRDIHDDMMALTLAIAGKTLFNVDVGHEAELVGEALELSLKMFNYTTALPLGAFWERLPLPWIRQMHRARADMGKFVRRLIHERRTSGTNTGDLLSMLIDARDPEDNDKGMNDQQVYDELLTLLLAGHETTATALSWTWYLLSQHPAVEAKLHAELDTVLAGRTPTVEDLPRLSYARMVLNEVLRVYPPAWLIGRQALGDIALGEYRIKAGTVILMPTFIIHRDPRWWSNPDQFDPERWAPDAPNDRPKFAYFPFGGGTRLCVGEQFAWMEGVLLLATIAQRWKLKHDPNHVVEPEALLTLRPRYGMRMEMTRR